MSRTERKELFDKCAQMMTAQSTEGWFSQSSLSRIQQGNVIEWLLWALFSTDAGHNLGEWEEELNSYISVFATIVGYPLDTGSNGELKTMRLTLDPVVMIHRPLIWYMVRVLDSEWKSVLITASDCCFGRYNHIRIFILPRVQSLQYPDMVARIPTSTFPLTNFEHVDKT